MKKRKPLFAIAAVMMFLAIITTVYAARPGAPTPPPPPPVAANPAITYTRASKNSAGYWRYDLMVMNTDGQRQTQLLQGVNGTKRNMPAGYLATGYRHPEFAPTGNQIVTFVQNPNNTCGGAPAAPELRVITYAVVSDVPTVTNQRVLTDCNNAPGNKQGDFPTWSPDGSTIAYTATTATYKTIETIPASGYNTGTVRYTSSNTQDLIIDLAWDPTSTKVAFAEQRYPGFALKVLDVTTNTVSDVLPLGAYTVQSLDWSHDGTRITFTGLPAGGSAAQRGIYTVDPTVGASSVQFIGASTGAIGVSWTPTDSAIVHSKEIAVAPASNLVIAEMNATTGATTVLADEAGQLHEPDRKS